MNVNLYKEFNIKKLSFYILCLFVFFMKTTNGQVCVGDTVKIENVASPNNFLADAGNGTSTLAASGNITWVIQRSDAVNGNPLYSSTFPKLMNVATGQYLGYSLVSASGGSSLNMLSGYDSGEYWTPVDLTLNTPSDVDTLVSTFGATRYPEQYTYVLYRGLSNGGDGKTYTTPIPQENKAGDILPGGYLAGYTTVGIVPVINISVSYNNKIAFVSNGGVVLGKSGANIIHQASCSTTSNQWYIRLVSSPIADKFSAVQATTKQNVIAWALNADAAYTILKSQLADLLASTTYQTNTTVTNVKNWTDTADKLVAFSTNLKALNPTTSNVATSISTLNSYLSNTTNQSASALFRAQ